MRLLSFNKKDSYSSYPNRFWIGLIKDNLEVKARIHFKMDEYVDFQKMFILLTLLRYTTCINIYTMLLFKRCFFFNIYGLQTQISLLIYRFPPFYYIQMRDLDFSHGLNFSRFGSNGWQNFAFDQASQSVSMLPRHVQPMNPHSLQLQGLLNEPPRPPASIYNCLQSDQQEQGDIHQVDYVQNQPQAKHVNSKQYFRMMKRRIKKVMDEYKRKEMMGRSEGSHQPDQLTHVAKQKLKYIYESRHKHAVRRLRGKDGKFLATRPESERFKEKKKRGRKPKVQTAQNASTFSQKN